MNITRQTIEDEITYLIEGQAQPNIESISKDVAEMFAEQLDEEFDHNIRQEHYVKLINALAEIFEDQIDWTVMDEIANPYKQYERKKEEREEAKANIYRGQHEQD